MSKEISEHLYRTRIRQELPLDLKVEMTRRRIRLWYEHWSGQVYVAFSGGKDSTVLLHLVRSLYPDVPAVFCDTGLEFPEIRDFVLSFDNLEILKPKMSFRKVIKDYGWPVISKEVSQKTYDYRRTKGTRTRHVVMHGDEKGNGMLSKKWHRLAKEAPFDISDRCCHVMKKRPAKAYERKTGRKPLLGTMACESRLRMWREQCNMFDAARPTSAPLHFWGEDDIWVYIRQHEIPYCSVYDMGYERTGCMFCMFGIHMEKNDRFEMMEKTHPKIHDYCMNKLGIKDVLKYIRNIHPKQTSLDL